MDLFETFNYIDTLPTRFSFFYDDKKQKKYLDRKNELEIFLAGKNLI